MQSKIHLANNALMRIGNTRFIESLSSAQQEAIVINRLFDSVRVRLLRRMPWPFAKKVVTLSLTPYEAVDWKFVYRYPAQALRVFKVFSNQARLPIEQEHPRPYEIQVINGVQVIATNIAQARALIVSDVEDTTEWDPLFEDAFIWALAVEIAVPLSGNNQLIQLAIDSANRAYDVARAASLSERQESTLTLPEFVRARL